MLATGNNYNHLIWKTVRFVLIAVAKEMLMGRVRFNAVGYVEILPVRDCLEQ